MTSICFLVYNIGNFSEGKTTGHTGDDLNEYIQNWKSFIESCNADMSLFTESRKYIGSGNKAETKTSLYSPLYQYVLDYYPSMNWGIAMLTRSEQSETVKAKFQHQRSSESKYVKSSILIGGIPVCVVAVHLIHGGETNKDIRAQQMDELIADLENYENVIIGGDFNTHDLNELEPLKNAGYVFANGGAFGTFNTHTVGDPTAPLDNLCVRSNTLAIKSITAMYNIVLSDHVPLLIEIGEERQMYYGFKFAGLSTDEKPINVQDNAIFLELDTAKTYYYKNGAWSILG